MRQSLIDSIRQERDLTSAIVLTHNIDFVFLQLVVLPALKAAGHPRLTIFADAHCAAETFENQAPIVGGIGVSYRVVPVLMAPGFRFHPKAVFLAGPDRARLFVGSGNLTFGGWVENGEVWVELTSIDDGTAQIAWFRQYLHRIADTILFAEPIRYEIDEAFDPANHPWALDMEVPGGLIGRIENEPSLMDQIAALPNLYRARHLTICSPFFDDSAEALKQLVSRFQIPEATVFVQSKRSNLTAAAVTTLPGNIKPVSISFKRFNKEGVERDSYLHAKYYAFEHGDIATVISGSANCSKAALLVPGKAGNAELMAVQTVSIATFQDCFINELKLFDDPPYLVDAPEEKTNIDSAASISITAARWEEGELLIGYKCSEGARLSRCIVDDLSVSFEVFDKGQALVFCGQPPRFVRLEGSVGGITIVSNLIWVDQERELRSTARGRIMGDTIRRKAREGYWGLDAWTDILDAFCKHLQYTPDLHSWRSLRRDRSPDKTVPKYSADDVFSNNFGLVYLGDTYKNPSVGFGSTTIENLLLKWFGGQAEPLEDPSTPNDEAPYNDPDDGGNGEKEDPVVDGPVDGAPPKRPPTMAKPTNNDRERIREFIERLTATVCTPEYMQRRSPEMLGADLKLLTVLLLTMLSKGWAKEEDFARCSSKIWAQLFLTCEADPLLGWITYRKNSCDDPEVFSRRLTSLDLAAAIAAWALRLPFDFSSPEKAVFSLCGIMSAARHQEMWCFGSLNKISEKLASDLLPLFPSDYQTKSNFELFGKRWRLMIRLGCSVQALEKAIEGRTPAEIKNLLSWSFLSRGELLWQGSNGLCITQEPVDRSNKQAVKVISLHDNFRSLAILADYLIPLRLLVKKKELFDGVKFTENHKRYLIALANRVKKEWFDV